MEAEKKSGSHPLDAVFRGTTSAPRIYEELWPTPQCGFDRTFSGDDRKLCIGGVDELQQRKGCGRTGHSINLAFVTSDIPFTQRLPQKDCSPWST
jgi:hypothetical protein